MSAKVSRARSYKDRKDKRGIKDVIPNLKTSFEDFGSNEKIKLSTEGFTLSIQDINSPSNLAYQFREQKNQDITNESEQIAKSCGIYLEFDRAKTGSEKDWMYMFRVTIPGGGPINTKQWNILDRIADKYTSSSIYTGKLQPSLRFTTRQNIQLHWVKKKDLTKAIREIAESGFYTLNGCGDNVRNVMGCPLSTYSELFNSNEWAQKVGKYFGLPTSAYMQIFQIDKKYMRELDDRTSEQKFKYGKTLLNRKFKIGFSTVHKDGERYVYDNCVEMRTNDIGIAPIVEANEVKKFQVYVGGGQGERTGYATYSALAEPLGIFDKNDLMKGLDTIVKIHQQWGDRENRHWARMKYVIYEKGIEWFRSQVRELSGIKFEMPNTKLDYGPRQLHFGWMKQEMDELWSYGAFVENGRIIDGPNGKIKSMISFLMNKYSLELFITPNQDIIFSNIKQEDKKQFEIDMQKFNYGFRKGKSYSNLRLLSGACVGRDTCRLTYTDSERFEPQLIDILEKKWGNMEESIGITGCERQCFRPGTKSLGWIGRGFNMYMLKIGGTEDVKFQGTPLTDPETREFYLCFVKREKVSDVSDALFEYYDNNKIEEDVKKGGMGYFFRRVGSKNIIDHLKKHPKTEMLMKKTIKNNLSEESFNKLPEA